ncbi:hypothetical protein O6P43_019553 [Quillaja saponaria]|uniref:Uncharacterized protein n=1 Tax=Quillaja saponaria TaxID=32244 RepID=A0AAD7PL79_QUISA|nr:hypothetical protein O6P43_019553 [Quillaja saponaria]
MQEMQIDMDSKFQILMETIASLIEVYSSGPDMKWKLQAIHESSILPTEGNQTSSMTKLSTSMNEGKDGTLKQKESVLPNFTEKNPNSPVIPQPPTLTDKFKIVAPSRNPMKETILQELLSPKDDKHEQEIQMGYQFSKLQNLGPCAFIGSIANLIRGKLDKSPCEQRIAAIFWKNSFATIGSKDWYDNKSSHTRFQAIMLWMFAVRYEDEKGCFQVAEMKTWNFYSRQGIQELICKKLHQQQ